MTELRNYVEKGTWKDKTLDYEIETFDFLSVIWTETYSWKDKTLDYEIETLSWRVAFRTRNLTWKDKTLDYEIETMVLFNLTALPFMNLKR